MLNPWKTLRPGLIALAACLVVVLWYGPLADRGLAVAPGMAPTGATVAPADGLGASSIDATLAAAAAPLLAQGATTGPIVTYVAMLNGQSIVPRAALTDARGVVGAARAGNRLVVRGNFRQLTSAPRDYATDPLDPPNPNITSAMHVHQGGPDENGPFQYALEVTLDATGRGGSAQGDYTLTPEQLQALQTGRLYIDFHTTRYRGGELRGVLMPA